MLLEKRRNGIATAIVVLVVVVVIAVAGIAAYYFYTTTATTTTTAAPAKVVKIAILLPGEQNDLSWNQAAYESALQMAHALNSSTVHVTLSVASGLYTSAEIQPAMTTYASEGYSFIIGDGFQDQSPANTVDSTYPNTGFLIADGYQTAANQAIVVQNGGQEGFMMGVLAALLDHSGTVAIIGGENVGDITWVTQGFLLGVNYTNTNFMKHVQVINTFIGNFNDPAAAESATASAIQSGADVVYCSGDGITEGAATAAVSANVPFLYNEFNASSLAPADTYGGVAFTFAPVFEQAFHDWNSTHAFASTPYYATFANDGMTLSIGKQVPSNDSTIETKIYNNVVNNNIQIYKELSNGTLVLQPVTPAYSSLS
jgi:basic membrane protein A and related proteins